MQVLTIQPIANQDRKSIDVRPRSVSPAPVMYMRRASSADMALLFGFLTHVNIPFFNIRKVDLLSGVVCTPILDSKHRCCCLFSHMDATKSGPFPNIPASRSIAPWGVYSTLGMDSFWVAFWRKPAAQQSWESVSCPRLLRIFPED